MVYLQHFSDWSNFDDRQYISCLASSMWNVAGGKGAKSFVDRCISYVGENAIECVKTNSFLNLPKDALVKLISSDCVCSLFLLIIFKCTHTENMKCMCLVPFWERWRRNRKGCKIVWKWWFQLSALWCSEICR